VLLAADITDEASVAAAFRVMRDAGDTIDVLVNNAGAARSCAIHRG
jgi:NADP-dependent 3-hydroxy acid dehydrogenase YdfG